MILSKEQIEAKSKLLSIGWKWSHETIQKGHLRCYASSDPFWLDTGVPKNRSLIVEIDPKGLVKMGDITRPA